MRVEIKDVVRVYEKISENKEIVYSFSVEDFKSKLGIVKKTRSYNSPSTNPFVRHLSLVASTIRSGSWVTGRKVKNMDDSLQKLHDKYNDLAPSECRSLNRPEIVSLIDTIYGSLPEDSKYKQPFGSMRFFITSFK